MGFITFITWKKDVMGILSTMCPTWVAAEMRRLKKERSWDDSLSDIETIRGEEAFDSFTLGFSPKEYARMIVECIDGKREDNDESRRSVKDVE